MFTAKIVSTCFGIGYLQKGAGTLAALLVSAAWLLLPVGGMNIIVHILAVVLILAAGIWSAAKVEKEWGHDSNRIVVDEVLGMAISLVMIPVNWKYVLAAFVLFRFFDILKPFFIRKAEALPSGWGVMADDLLAGIYANLILQLLIRTGLFNENICAGADRLTSCFTG
jgi:phosphatidylglycerophosphatase A